MAAMTRESVYGAVDGERKYQYLSARDGEHPDMKPVLSVGETLLAMEHNLAAARREWYHGADNHEYAMNYIRKITALGVQAGENFGMPRREGY